MIKILITQAGTGWSGLTKKEQAQWLSDAGKELLAQGVSQWFGVRWDSGEEKNRELATERNACGKPFLVRHSEIHFNISHSGSLAACGFSGEPLGLDIQQCAAADYFRMADRFYTKADRELLRQTEETEREKVFYQIWTKEESYAKWLGTALPKSIGKENKEGFCRWFEPMPGYQGAVWTGKPEEIEIQWIF